MKGPGHRQRAPISGVIHLLWLCLKCQGCCRTRGAAVQRRAAVHKTQWGERILQVNRMRKAPLVLPEANQALLFQRLADKCSTDSQLIFNNKKTKRRFTPGEKWRDEKMGVMGVERLSILNLSTVGAADDFCFNANIFSTKMRHYNAKTISMDSVNLFTIKSVMVLKVEFTYCYCYTTNPK